MYIFSASYLFVFQKIFNGKPPIAFFSCWNLEFLELKQKKLNITVKFAPIWRYDTLVDH